MPSGPPPTWHGTPGDSSSRHRTFPTTRGFLRRSSPPCSDVSSRAEILESARGPGGGYKLALPADQISLYDIKAAVDGVAELNACAVGLAVCSDETPCPLHDTWKPIRAQINDYLMRTTLQRMAEAMSAKQVP